MALVVVLLAGYGLYALFNPQGSPAVFHPHKIAVIEIDGIILDSKKWIEEIRDFADENSVAAIVLRINSPGGAIAPSQEIYQEVLKARAKKKVLVSMGSLAASGGYYIAAGAHKIVANPGTITGSIGVIMQFMNLEDLQKFLKLKPVTLKSGPFKDAGSANRELTPEEKRYFQGIIAEMLEQFIADISQGRQMDAKEIRKHADGRIFTGVEAKKRGLVDELGNLQDTIDLAAKMSGVDGKPDVIYPKKDPRSLAEYILGSDVGSSIKEMLMLKGLQIPFFLMVMP